MRNWVVTLGVVVGVVALCGVVVGGWSWDSKRERTRSDDAVRAYLNAVMNGDYDAAYALVCTDETGTDRSSFDEDERSNPIRGFEIESSTAWSSWVDGHGRSYQVRVTHDTGSGVVEIPTQGSDPVCVQYSDIRDLQPSPSPSTGRPTARVGGQPTSTS
jgi:hypothetical protein